MKEGISRESEKMIKRAHLIAMAKLLLHKKIINEVIYNKMVSQIETTN